MVLRYRSWLPFVLILTLTAGHAGEGGDAFACRLFAELAKEDGNLFISPD
jgi:hypothetical protein